MSPEYSLRWYAVIGQVGEQRVVGFPSVGEFGADAEVDGFVGGVAIKNVGYPGAGTTIQAWPWREASTHRRPASRWKAVASLRPDSGCGRW